MVADVDALPVAAAEVGEVVFEDDVEPHAATAMGTTMARGMRRFKEFFPFLQVPGAPFAPVRDRGLFDRFGDHTEAR